MASLLSRILMVEALLTPWCHGHGAVDSFGLLMGNFGFLLIGAVSRRGRPLVRVDKNFFECEGSWNFPWFFWHRILGDFFCGIFRMFSREVFSIFVYPLGGPVGGIALGLIMVCRNFFHTSFHHTNTAKQFCLIYAPARGRFFIGSLTWATGEGRERLWQDQILYGNGGSLRRG